MTSLSLEKNAHHSLLLGIFSFTLLLSAACMFVVQPMVGKMLLPLVGGASAGWVVALAFFQVALLAGYALAWGLSFLSPRMHGIAYLAVLAAGILFLPLTINQDMAAGVGAVDVFMTLVLTLAIPFVALSATSSTIQRLFSATHHGLSEDPYFLYAASNLGSFAGLLAYPVLIEPYAGLVTQAVYWQAGYLTLMVFGILCLFFVSDDLQKINTARQPLTRRRRAEWVAFAFFPSSLLLGITAFITTDVFSVPMVWVVPLALYLLTFVIAFSRRAFVSFNHLEKIVPYAVMLVILILLYQRESQIFIVLPVCLFSFTVVALYCHMRLAHLRPVEDSCRLTEFYFYIALGGAIGGILNAFLLPVLLDRLIEFPLMLLALLFFHPRINSKNIFLTGMAVLFAAAFFVSSFFATKYDIISAKRNFYGVTKIFRYDVPMQDGSVLTLQGMRHGTTLHGEQVMSGPYKTRPGLYFNKNGPVGDVFDHLNPHRVAVMGLGVGTLNCYNAPYRDFTFIEIDRHVIDMAQQHFTYLSDCPSRVPPRIIQGDGRKVLESMVAEKFDLIVMDAFSSDAIPAHLLTSEALKIYFSRLNEDGILLINISNRFFMLHDVVAATAYQQGLKSYIKIFIPDEEDFLDTASYWMIVMRPDKEVAAFKSQEWMGISFKPDVRFWTDDYTNPLSTLRYFVLK